MQTKFKIIETEEYILAVFLIPSKKGQLCYDIIDNTIFTKEYDSIPHPLSNDNPVNENNYLPIVAYQPKNNAPELDLPLLPEMAVEDDVEKLAEIYAEENAKDNNISYHNLYSPLEYAFKAGHKAATKVYREEDLRKAIEIGEKCIILNSRGSYLESKQLKESFIQSLKQPTPKWFVAEMQTTKSEVFRENDNVPYATLKTTTINGKTYLVGKFENE